MVGGRTLNHLSEDITKLSGAFERGGANLKGERALRPANDSATSAYPRDQDCELSAPCPLAQAVGRPCARRSCCLHRRRCVWRSPDPRGRALDSARPCPSRGWVPASQPGSEDFPERQERRSARRFAHQIACPCPRPCTRCDVCIFLALTVCAVAVRMQRALLVHPTAPSPAPPPLPLQCPHRTFVSQCFRGSEWVPRVSPSPTSVLCVRFRASFGGRVNVLSCLWAFGAAVGVHMDRLHPSVMNTRVRVVGHVIHGGPGSHQC